MPEAMKTSLAAATLAVLSTSVLVAPALAAPAYDELTADQKTQIQQGKQVFWTQEMAESLWPKVYVFQRVEASPEEVAALFHDYAYHPKFIPKIKSCVITKQKGPAAELDYVLSVPAFEDERYSVIDTVSKTAEGYKILWTFVKASTTKSIEGNVRFEALGTGTLIAYYSYIVPGRSGAGIGWIVNGAKGAVKDTVAETAKEVLELRTKKPAQLQDQITRLRAALAK